MLLATRARIFRARCHDVSICFSHNGHAPFDPCVHLQSILITIRGSEKDTPFGSMSLAKMNPCLSISGNIGIFGLSTTKSSFGSCIHSIANIWYVTCAQERFSQLTIFQYHKVGRTYRERSLGGSLIASGVMAKMSCLLGGGVV